MQRMGMAIRIRPEKLADYRALHAAPWPEMDQALRGIHIRNYSNWLEEREMRQFGYWEYHGADLNADMARLGTLPITQRWLALTDACQRPMSPGKQGWTFLPQLDLLNRKDVSVGGYPDVLSRRGVGVSPDLHIPNVRPRDPMTLPATQLGNTRVTLTLTLT